MSRRDEGTGDAGDAGDRLSQSLGDDEDLLASLLQLKHQHAQLMQEKVRC